MKIWKFEDNLLTEQESLWKTLEMPEAVCCGESSGNAVPYKKGLVISLVGAGGKTSTMYRLAEELAAMGKRVIVTTSTHIFRPSDRVDRPVLLGETAQELTAGIRQWEAGREERQRKTDTQGSKRAPGFVIVTGRAASEPGKLKGLPVEELGRLALAADVLLIEADGARRLPLKIPREGEPVVIPETDILIGCAGLGSIGRPFEEGCFRSELLFHIFGGTVRPEDIIKPHHVAAILLSGRGTKKELDGTSGRVLCAYRIVLNQADGEEERRCAGEIITAVRAMETIPCAVTCHRDLI